MYGLMQTIVLIFSSYWKNIKYMIEYLCFVGKQVKILYEHVAVKYIIIMSPTECRRFGKCHWKIREVDLYRTKSKYP